MEDTSVVGAMWREQGALITSAVNGVPVEVLKQTLHAPIPQHSQTWYPTWDAVQNLGLYARAADLKPTVVRIDTELVWRTFRDPKTQRWVSVCDDLTATAEAETWRGLQVTWDEIVFSFFHRLWKAGTLSDWLHHRRWANSPLPSPGDGTVIFDVPNVPVVRASPLERR